MDKYTGRKLVKDIYRRLILKYHREGKDSSALMSRLKEISIKNASKNK